MAELSFFIPAIPRGQARVRHTSVNGFSRTYKSKDQQADERTLEALMMPHVPQMCLAGAIELLITAFMPVPKSKPKKWQNNALEGQVHPTGRPDADNLAKNITDCLVRMRFITDDRLICRLLVEKRYGATPGYQVMMREM